VVAVTPNQELVLVRQYRVGIGVETLELPGGIVDEGEEHHFAAQRELREETSIEVGEMALAYVFDAINEDEDGRARYHYTIIDFAAHWLEGEARAGDDVSEVAWALPHELVAYDLTEAAHEAIAAARVALGLR
jgi:ADP-ribose pyrophosphatase YjhB (NUDIX family)